MNFPFPLFVKKRGQRRTGSDDVGRWGELLFYLVFIVAGGFVLAWHLIANIIPDWRAASELSGLQSATCKLIDKRIAPREFILPTVKEPDYRAELLMALLTEGGESEPVWTYDGTGEYAPSRDDAERTLSGYEVGKTYACRIDPDNPDRIILGRSYRWWPWLILLIPVSLLLFGAVGSVNTLRQWNASTEWQVVSQQMSSFDMSAINVATRPAFDGIPSVARVTDSPGIRLAHRLPIDGSSNWRLGAMSVVTALWNLLVIYFLWQLIGQFLQGKANGVIAALVLPFAFVGVWLIVLLVRDAWNIVGIGTTQLEIANHPLYPGTESRLFLMQSGQMTVRQLTVWLLCEERAVFQEGTDTREWIETVYREEVLRERNVTIEHGEPFEAEFELQIPAHAMHSFQSPHNEVRWSLEVRGSTLRWPEFQRRFPIYVYPSAFLADVDPISSTLPNEEVAEA